MNNIDKTEKLRKLIEINNEYRKIRKDNLVYEIEIHCIGGTYIIKNQQINSKIIDMLIKESQKLIESEANNG